MNILVEYALSLIVYCQYWQQCAHDVGSATCVRMSRRVREYDSALRVVTFFNTF